MTPTELVVEKVRKLSESQANIVLAFIDGISESPRISPSDLMRLPVEHRHAILEAQAAKAESLYRNDPELVCEDTEAPLPYG